MDKGAVQVGRQKWSFSVKRMRETYRVSCGTFRHEDLDDCCSVANLRSIQVAFISEQSELRSEFREQLEVKMYLL